jgi:hypothetical protein
LTDEKTLSFDHMGGFNSSRSQTNYPEHEAFRSWNMRLHNSFAKRRLGGTKFNNTQLPGSGNVLGLFDFRYGASGQKFIEVENTVMYTDTGMSRASIKTGLTAGNYGVFESFDNFMWWVNGVDTPLKYDGTTVTNASIANPDVGSFAVAISSAGNLDGTYQYLVTFYVSATGQESQPFPIADAYSSVTVSSKRTYLTYIPISSDSQVTARKIYRTTGTGSLYNARLVTTIEDNTTTVYEDNIADSSLGDLIELNHDPMPTLTKIVKHNDRFFGFTENSSRLYVSRQFNVWYWPQGLIDLSPDQELFYIDIEPDDGEKIKNIESYYEYLIVWKTNSIHIIDGYDFYELSRRKLFGKSGIGCVGKHGAAVAPDGWCYFIDVNGIYRTNLQVLQYREFGDKAEKFFDANNSDSSSIIRGSKIDEAFVHVDNTKPNTHVLFSFATGLSDTNNKTLTFNYLDQEWNEDSGYNAQFWATRTVSGKEYIIRGDDYGYVWTENQMEGDGGSILSTATGGDTYGLIDTEQSATTDVYKGTYIEILTGTGKGQRKRISHNTDTCFACDTCFNPSPDTTSYYTIGGIDGQYYGPFHHYGDAIFTKNLSHIMPKMASNGSYGITMSVLYDFQNIDTAFETQTLAPTSISAWDAGLYDISKWDNTSLSIDMLYAAPNNIHRYSTIGFKHKPAGQGFTVYGYHKVYYLQGLGIR